MASAQVIETSVAKNSPSQDSNHPDDLSQARYKYVIKNKNSNLAMNTIMRSLDIKD